MSLTIKLGKIQHFKLTLKNKKRVFLWPIKCIKVTVASTAASNILGRQTELSLESWGKLETHLCTIQQGDVMSHNSCQIALCTGPTPYLLLSHQQMFVCVDTTGCSGWHCNLTAWESSDQILKSLLNNNGECEKCYSNIVFFCSNVLNRHFFL